MDAIRRGRRKGSVFKAHCVGQSQPSYRVWAEVEAGRIVAAECSCYVGEEGRCKHVAALLITAVNDPQRFVVTADLASRLDKCDKSRLVELIVQLVDRAPRVEEWLDKELGTKPEQKGATDDSAY